jgi:hypothetical protein
MKPNEKMIEILMQNGCKCMFRYDNPFLYLWVNYENAIKKDPSKGLMIWGDSQQILDKVKSTVFHFYPQAELTSESGNKNATFNLTS